MEFEPSTEYYNGMPLKKNEAGAVMPTTGEPEYICLWDYQPDGDIRTLEIPVIEVFPDTIYEKWNEDGSVEEVRFGSGGGGGDLLNENGKLKNEVLPDGYPYKEVKDITFEHTPGEKEWEWESWLEGFPAFAKGDTVKLKVDGVEYSLVAVEGYDGPYIGDDRESISEGSGEYRWHAYFTPEEDSVYFISREPHIVSWESVNISTMAKEYLSVDYKVIELFIDYIDNPRHVYLSVDKIYNNEPMTKNDFMALIPCNDEGHQVPHVVVLNYEFDATRYTVLEYRIDYDKIDFYVLELREGTITPVTYSTVVQE